MIIGVLFSLVITLAKANIPSVVVLERDKESKEWLDRARYKVTRDNECLATLQFNERALNTIMSVV